MDVRKYVMVGLLLWLSLYAGAQTLGERSLSEKFLALTPQATWIQSVEVKLQFNAHHTQGLVRVGDYFYLSAVEVIRWPKGYEQPVAKYDRDTGLGRGHIFQFDGAGNLIRDLPIGEGDVYHPGGMDFDGRYIWIPVTEYRPNSFSILYRLDPETMTLTEMLRFEESIGAVACDRDACTVTGVNWGARRFYTWQLNDSGEILNSDATPEELGIENLSFYVDFQDCKYIGDGLMLGSGHQNYRQGDQLFRIGGWELFDLTDFRPRRQIPITLLSPAGGSMLNNPCAVESIPNGIRAYFVPDDDEKATLFVYDIEVK